MKTTIQKEPSQTVAAFSCIGLSILLIVGFFALLFGLLFLQMYLMALIGACTFFDNGAGIYCDPGMSIGITISSLLGSYAIGFAFLELIGKKKGKK